MSDEYLPASITPHDVVSPSDSDYDVIHAAVTESERGRWFLAEYARRNRHADTEQVLAAIARLETALVAARAAEQQTRLRGDIAEMVRAIATPKPADAASQPECKQTIDRTEVELDAIIAATERATTDILAAAERIQEIAWTLREQGIDDKACAELDGLAIEIYTACSFQDLTGQQTDRVIEHLRHPDEADDNEPRLDQAGIDRVVPARAASPDAKAAMATAAAVITIAAAAVAESRPEAAPASNVTPLFEPAAAEPSNEAPDEMTATDVAETEVIAETTETAPDEAVADIAAEAEADEASAEPDMAAAADAPADAKPDAVAAKTPAEPVEVSAPDAAADVPPETPTPASELAVEAVAEASASVVETPIEAAASAAEPETENLTTVLADAPSAEPAETADADDETPQAAIAGLHDPVAMPAETEAAPGTTAGDVVDTDALLADLLTVIRQARDGEPAARQSDPAPHTDVVWVEGESVAKPDAASAAPQAAPAAPADEDDLLLPMPVSWADGIKPSNGHRSPDPQTSRGAPAPESADNPPSTAPVAEPTPAVAAALALSRPSPLAEVAAAALSGEILSSDPTPATPAATVELPEVAPPRPQVSTQALAAVAALSALSEPEKVALFS